MKTKIQICFLIFSIACTNSPIEEAQYEFRLNEGDSVIFLSPYFSQFVNQAKNDPEKLNSYYDAIIKDSLYHNYFVGKGTEGIISGIISNPISNLEDFDSNIVQLNLNIQSIVSEITKALEASRKYISNTKLSIYVFPSDPSNFKSMQIMGGVSGITVSSKNILLFIDPSIENWELNLRQAIAHEYFHTYMLDTKFVSFEDDFTLLDYIIFEGKADVFAQYIYPDIKVPWSYALEDNQAHELWGRIKHLQNSTDYLHQRQIMFGSNVYPKWGGYSLGFKMMHSFIKNTSKTEIDTWALVKPHEILEKSDFK